jgi:hypothetical protein
MTKKAQKRNNLQKALDEAVWINFRHRATRYRVGVIQSVEGGYILAHPKHSVHENEHFEILPSDCSNMTYDHIASIGMDEDPLTHWEEIRGVFQILDGELLRFLLAKKVPLEKIIRYELACRGHNKNHQWVDLKKPRRFGLKKIEYESKRFTFKANLF